MNCHEMLALLHPYVDGELDLVRSLELDHHLEQCPACAEALRKEQGLRDALRNPSLYHRAPADLRDQLRSAIRRGRGGRRPLSGAAGRVLAVAASLAVVALLSWAVVRVRSLPSAEDRVAQEVVSSHVRSLMASHLLDVASTNQHTVKPWFAGRLDFAPAVENLADKDYSLVGGRLDYIDNHKAAALVYNRRNHVINLFIWPATGAADEAPRVVTLQGYHVVHWTRAGLTYWAVSDLNERELQQFARLIDHQEAPGQ
jgi:mycothiol system anti-sigma-R factor